MSSDAANKSVLSVHDPTYPVREAQVSSNLRRWCPSFSASNKIASIFLFCFPFAGGAASAFGNWAANFADNITICPIQYPGRETRWSDPGFEQLSALVDTLADDFADRWPSRFAFLGHSFGALVAYELARTLTQRGHPTPLRLFLSGARAFELSRIDETYQAEKWDEDAEAAKRTAALAHELDRAVELIGHIR